MTTTPSPAQQLADTTRKLLSRLYEEKDCSVEFANCESALAAWDAQPRESEYIGKDDIWTSPPAGTRGAVSEVSPVVNTLRKCYQFALTPDTPLYIEAYKVLRAYDAQAASLTRLLSQECNDADALLRLMKLDPSECRTESGFINLSKVRHLIESFATARPEGNNSNDLFYQICKAAKPCIGPYYLIPMELIVKIKEYFVNPKEKV